MNVSEPIPGIVDAPDKVAHLFWNDNTGTQASDKAVGPSIAFKVNAGDEVKIETWTRYEDKLSFNKDLGLVALSSLLGNTLVSNFGFEGLSLGQTTGGIESALTAATCLTMKRIIPGPTPT